MSTVGGVSSAAKLYSLSFKANDTAYTPNNRVTLSFDIPDEWDADKTQLYVFFADEKSSMNINSEYGEVNVENGKLNYTTTKLDGYQYILFQKSDVTDVSTLSDGVYSVGVNIWNYEQPESPSMANNAVRVEKQLSMFTIMELIRISILTCRESQFRLVEKIIWIYVSYVLLSD